MAKKKNTNEIDFDEFCLHIANQTGGDVLDKLDTVKFFIDTGNLAINHSCSGKYINGGVPAGRIIEFYGPEASGKTLIGSNVLAGTQRIKGWSILLDCENASNKDFMEKVSHVDAKKIIRYTPPTLEVAFRTINESVNKIREYEKAKKLDPMPITILYDSLTVSPCERELRENNLPIDYNPADWKKIVGRQEQPGERAKIISGALRKLQSMVVEKDVTVVFINQTRDKIGVLYGSPETIPGGNSMKYYASLRVRTATKKKIEHSKLKTFCGVNMQVKNIKNRMFKPFVVADEVKLYFENGIDPISGILNCLIEDGRIIAAKKAGSYTVAEDYLPEGVEEYKFSALKANNTVDKKVLLDCPKLIDAESTEQVQEYLDFWGSGLAASESGQYEEKPVAFDSDGNPLEIESPEDYEDDAESEE